MVAPACLRPSTSPSVSISFPTDIPFETVQIYYHMVGAFGGRGGQVESHPDIRVSEINASFEGQPATAIKILVYAQGCDIVTFDLSLTSNPNPYERFQCSPLPKVSLSGQVPSDLIQNKNAELVVTYMAYWAHNFFGIADGAVAGFQLATVFPSKDGTFDVELTDFSVSANVSRFSNEGDLRLMLRDAKTRNHIALNLVPKPPSLKSDYGGLKTLSSYPRNLQFDADPQ